MNSVYVVNLYTVSKSNPVTMFIFLIFSLALCWGFSNSNVTMKFAQLHYFLSQNIVGTKDIVFHLSKSWGGMSPLKLVRCLLVTNERDDF